MSEGTRPPGMLSALAQAGRPQEGIHTHALALSEVETISVVRLRALAKQAGAGQAPLALPGQTGACAGADPAVLCLRPGEWLVVGDALPPGALLEHVRGEYGQPGYFAWDDSEGLTLLRVEGPAAPWLLAKHCGLDFSSGTKAKTNCAQTKFAHISVLIHYYASRSEPIFDLFVDRSLARYLWELLADSVPHAKELHSRHGRHPA